jgi:hypothetical protein
MAETNPPLTEEERRNREEHAHHENVKRQPFYALSGALAVALLLLVIHSSAAGDRAIVLFAVELVLGLAALLGAGLLGFLFGIPRTPKLPAADGGGRQATASYEPNNNLEQVSDWLTKILVGAGLVELDDLRGSLSDIGAGIARAVDGGTATSAVAQLIIVAFSVIGFVGAFFWTRIYYGGIQVHADQNILSQLTRSLQLETQKAAVQVRKAREVASATGKLTQSAGGGQVAPKASAVVAAINDQDLERKIAQFREAPAIWDSDPVRDLFGTGPSAKDGLTFTGQLETVLDDESLILTLTVQGGEARRLEGSVLFLLHPTYGESVRSEAVRDNRASLTVYSESWYHAAAIVGQTVLVLDLRTIPGAPEWFKAD